MKTVAIDARRALPPRVLKAAEQEPVLLTVRGRPRFLIHSLTPKTLSRAKKSPKNGAKKRNTSEDLDWVAFASSRLLAAYSDEDAIYDELYAR